MSDAKDAKKDSKEGDDAGAAPAKSSKLMPILVGANSLLLFGVLGFLAMQMTKKDEGDHKADAKAEGGEHAGGEKKGHDEEKKKKEGEKSAEGHEPGGPLPAAGPMVRIPDFVVHLRNPDMDRYARMSFDVEVFTEADKERITASLPRIRDAFISYLSDRTVEDLRGSEGLGRTKDALQTRLRELVSDARIRALYISDFVVQ
jgi:flagellar FliL protein